VLVQLVVSKSAEGVTLIGTLVVARRGEVEQWPSLIRQKPRLAPYRPKGLLTVIERMGEPHMLVGSTIPGRPAAVYIHGPYAFVPNATS
jgi:hypothetical protein